MYIYNITIIYSIVIVYEDVNMFIFENIPIPCGAQAIGFLFSAAFSPGENITGYVGIIYIWLVVYDTYNLIQLITSYNYGF